MLNLNNNYICTLDIGSSKISACVVQIKGGHLKRIFFETMPSRGVQEGIIIDSVELIGSLSKILKNLKLKSGINIKSVYTNISGQNILTRHSRAIIPLAERGNKVVTISDIERVNEQARILGSSLEDEIINLVPLNYSIDSKSNIINPLGLYSHKLEVDLYLICGRLSSIQSISRVINQSGYEIQDLFFSGLSTSKAVFDKELNDGLNLFCDIGSDTTELLLFRNGILNDIHILPLGGDNLTRQLQDEFKIPFDLAEDIKRSYGVIGNSQQIAEDKEILIKKTNLYKPIKQRLVSEIISSKAKFICSAIKDVVEKKVSCYEVNNFIVVGRTILLEGFIEALENALAIPVKLGRITNSQILSLINEDTTVSGQKYLTYLTNLGMLCEISQGKTTGILPVNQPTKNPILRAINRFKEVYQEYF